MMRLKLDQDSMELSSFLERLTGARVKDCFKDAAGETLCFIVATGDLGKAIGKGGSQIKKVQQELGKRIKVIEYQENIIDFVKNIIYPLTVAEITEEGSFLVIKDPSTRTKSLLIGRDGRNLLLINRAVKRFFNKEVKVE